MINQQALKRMPARRLRQHIARHSKALEHKLAVAARHAPGTSYHTRATLEAETHRSRLEMFQTELESRSN